MYPVTFWGRTTFDSGPQPLSPSLQGQPSPALENCKGQQEDTDGPSPLWTSSLISHKESLIALKSKKEENKAGSHLSALHPSVRATFQETSGALAHSPEDPSLLCLCAYLQIEHTHKIQCS